MSRPTHAVIDLDNLYKTYMSIRKLTGDSVELFPVVKANAYGHGDIEIVKTLKGFGVKKFCVAIVEEAQGLIESGVDAEYIVLDGVFPGDEEAAVRLDLRPVIFRKSDAERLDREALKQNKR